jgi:hypothetical protein
MIVSRGDERQLVCLLAGEECAGWIHLGKRTSRRRRFDRLAYQQRCHMVREGFEDLTCLK